MTNAQQDQVLRIADGNPGAVAVLAAAFELDARVLEAADQLGMRGSGVWCVFKDECLQDLKFFVATVLERHAKRVA